MVTIEQVRDKLARWVCDEGEAVMGRFMSDGRGPGLPGVPGFIAGHRSFSATNSAVMALLAVMRRLGVRDVVGQPIEDAAASLLSGVDPKAYKTWWSLFIADGLRAFGEPWEDNPIVQRLSAADRDRLAGAIDSSHVVDLEKGELIGHPNNYWLVMARLETARLALGLTDDTTIRDLAMPQAKRFLAGGDFGYLDDSEKLTGRYDSYMVSTIVEAEPILADWPEEDLKTITDAMTRLLLTTTHPDGMHTIWGRSASGDAVHRTAQLAALVLRYSKEGPRETLLGLCNHATDRVVERWWADNAMTDHRSGNVHWYLGVGRLLERGICRLMGLGEAALMLGEVAADEPDLAAETEAAALFPERREYLKFDQRGHGVWVHRTAELSFQVPLVDGFTSCYAAAPIWPGFLEQVVDSGMACGVPNVLINGKRWLPLIWPSDVEYDAEAGRLSWTNDAWVHWTDWDWWKGRETLAGSRRVTLTVEGDAIVGEEVWELPAGETPGVDAVGIWFAESETELAVEWATDAAHQAFTTVVDGMPEWRSGYGPIRKLHQLDIREPGERVTVRYRVKRKG